MIRFPPPLCLRNVILLRGNGHRPDKSHFLRPPKLGLEGVLYGTFSPPQNRTTIRLAPPLCELPTENPSLHKVQSFLGKGMRRSIFNGRVLYRAGAETPLNFREKFRVFPRTILENFSGVDTQTAVLVSTAEVWISAPDTQTPIFLGFPGIHS